MASGLTGNEVPGNRLWVRVLCPPLESCQAKLFGRTAGPGVGAAFPLYGWVPNRFVDDWSLVKPNFPDGWLASA